MGFLEMIGFALYHAIKEEAEEERHSWRIPVSMYLQTFPDNLTFLHFVPYGGSPILFTYQIILPLIWGRNLLMKKLRKWKSSRKKCGNMLPWVESLHYSMMLTR